MHATRTFLAASVLALLVLAVGPGQSMAASCAPIKNPYAGTRYEGIDLRKIRATNVHCKRARRVVRRAHYKALGLPPEPIRTFRWRKWRVRGDIRDPVDRYVARRSGKRVRWVF